MASTDVLVLERLKLLGGTEFVGLEQSACSSLHHTQYSNAPCWLKGTAGSVDAHDSVNAWT